MKRLEIFITLLILLPCAGRAGSSYHVTIKGDKQAVEVKGQFMLENDVMKKISKSPDCNCGWPSAKNISGTERLMLEPYLQQIGWQMYSFVDEMYISRQAEVPAPARAMARGIFGRE